jgi:hypothetical protein
MLVTTRGLISDGGFSTPQRHELRQGAKPLSIRLAPENFTAQGSVWWGAPGGRGERQKYLEDTLW